MVVNTKALEQLLLGCVAGQNGKGLAATFLDVAERDGKIVAFLAGSCSRVYNIGEELVTSDLFLINEGGHAADTLALVDSYIAWAKSQPKVIEIGLSWSDAAGGAGIAAVFKRKGFKKVGEQWELRLDGGAE